MAVELYQPPLSSPVSAATNYSNPDSHLDDQILAIRAEIVKLRAHKSRLSFALLGSSKIQKCIQARKSHIRNAHAQNSNDDDPLQKRLEEAIETQQNENDIKIHRLAYGVTAFPFTDPSPERAGEPTLTGVRFDLGKANFETSNGDNDGGSATESYFVVLRRIRHQRVIEERRTNMTYLKVHHHTIPAHIDLEDLTYKHLPLPPEIQDAEAMDVDEGDNDGQNARAESESFNDDSGIDVTQDIIVVGDTIGTAAAAVLAGNGNDSGSSDTSRVQICGNGQNLHKFVFAIRDDLQAWHNRVQSIAYLREAVGLPAQPSVSSVAADNDQISVPSAMEHGSEVVPKYAISDLVRTTADAYQIRIVWNDDALGLLKLSYEGTVDRAVVYGVSRNVKGGADDEGSAEQTSQDGQIDVQHERLCDMERILTYNKAGEKMHVHHLLDGLKRCEEMFNDGQGLS